MSDDRTRELPSEIREALEREAPEDPEDLRRIWELIDRVEAGRAYDVEAGWERLIRAMEERADGGPGGVAAAPETEPRRDGGRGGEDGRAPAARRLAAAAVLVLAAVVGFAWWWTAPVSRAAPPGQQVTVILPDGSTARLNASSRISYDRGFRDFPGIGTDGRQVSMDGEAFFTVRRGDGPFRVQTPNAAVRVLGTRFTVRSRGGASGVTEVVLVEGRLRLRSRAGRGPDAPAVELERPGQASRVRGRAAPTEPVARDLDRATAWLRGGFSMARMPLREVLAELERRFDTRVRLRAPGAADDTLTLYYGSRVEIEDVLRDLAIIQGLRFRATARGYELYRD